MSGFRCIRTVAAIGFAAALIALGGCNKTSREPEVLSLEGRIEKIKTTDDSTGEISVVYFNEKQGREITGTASVNASTEITINGAAGKLKDLREGERIKGRVRVEKKGEQQHITALKIQVERASSEGGS